MQFGTEKCKIQSLTRGKLHQDITYDTISEESIDSIGSNEVYKYLGIQQCRTIEHMKIKERMRNEFLYKLKQILKSSLNSRNLTTAINTYVIPIIVYTMGVVKWSNTDLEGLDRIVRVQMTKYRNRHPKSSVERMYIPRKEGGLGFVNLSDMNQRQIISMRSYFMRRAHSSNLHNAICATDDRYTPLNLKHDYEISNTTTQERKETWRKKALHGRHPTSMDSENVDKVWSNHYLKAGQLFPETEGYIIAIQDQVIPTRNYLKYIIKDVNIKDDKCRICGKYGETIQHITGGCSVLAPIEYKRRHDDVGKIIHHALAVKYKLHSPGLFDHKYSPPNILQNQNFKLYWDRSILTDRTTHANRPDLLLWDLSQKKVWIVDFAVVNDNNLESTKNTKIQKYRELSQNLKEQWRLKQVTMLPMVLSTTGIIPKSLKDSLEKLELSPALIAKVQKAAILNTCTIVRKVMGN